MLKTSEVLLALDGVRKAIEEAAAEKPKTVVALNDPVIRTWYFRNIREAGSRALMAAGEIGGSTELLLHCHVLTPAIDAMQAIDDSNLYTEDGSHEFTVDIAIEESGELQKVISWPIRVAGVLDFDGDGK